jgi:hypothetical protein
MNTKQRITVVLVLAISLIVSSCAPGQLFGPTITPTPTMTPTSTMTPTELPTSTPMPLLTYSDILKTYPQGTKLCSNLITCGPIYIVDQQQNGDIVFCGSTCITKISASDTIIRQYGVKVEIWGTTVVLEGKTYIDGTKLTVDKEKNWIEVSSWDE